MFNTPSRCTPRFFSLPFSCPICGMALEPLVAQRTQARSAELVTCRGGSGLVCAEYPGGSLEMGGHLVDFTVS